MERRSKNGHHPKCACCNGKTKEDLEKWHEEKLKKNGFYMHFVPYPGGWVSCHTHGVEGSWGHPDFEIVIPLPEDVVSSVMWTLVDRVKAGERFQTDKEYDRVVKGYKVKFSWATEGGRDVLRVILPDVEGRFPGDEGVNERFGMQETLNLKAPSPEDN